MCGIAAIISPEPTVTPPDALRRMVMALQHRGPDANGERQFDGCWLGHTRLSIIDLAGGTQPMSDPTDRWHITFNGEIYNYRDLRRDLEERGVRFLTESDTEVLLLAYREFGEQVVEHLNGQFAFAIWDAVEQKLFAARDRMGEKPLFWSVTERGELILASEIRALLASGLVQPQIDCMAVDTYLALIYVPPDRSIYKNVDPLPPGHTLTWQRGKMRQVCYWRPELSNVHFDITLEEAARHTRWLMERAVKRQMVADVPVGAFLSGGLDSTTIVGLMSQQTPAPVRTFAVGFGDLINELPFARAVAERYDTEHAELQMNIDVGELLERMADIYDEPFGDSSNIPTFLVAEFARRQVKVVLSGDGGDELFGGYSWYTPLLSHDQLPTDWLSLARHRVDAKVTGALAKVGVPLARHRDQAAALYRGIQAKRRSPDLWQRHLTSLTIQARDQRRRLWQQPANSTAEDFFAAHYKPAANVSGIDRAVEFDLRCYLPGDICVKVDRAAMANSLETRSPFLDVELVEFVLSLPPRIRFENGGLKPLLHRACADLWPEVIRNRSKQGFGAPLAAWLQRPDVISLRQRVFRPGSPLTELLPGLLSSPPDPRRESQATWNLLCLGLWLEKRTACLGRLSSVA